MMKGPLYRENEEDQPRVYKLGKNLSEIDIQYESLKLERKLLHTTGHRKEETELLLTFYFFMVLAFVTFVFGIVVGAK
jgi:hypothetical protein